MHGCVVAVASDDGIATVIELELLDRGMTSARHTGDNEECDAFIVVISNAALGDSNWTNAIAFHSADRLVPVRYEEVDADDHRIPETVRELNWLAWDPIDAVAFYDSLFASLLADPGWRDERRVLENESESWSTAGRREDLLIDDRSRVSVAVSNLSSRADHASLRPSDTLREFVRASTRHTRKLRRRRIRKIAIRILLVAAIVAGSLLLWDALKQPKANNKLAFNLSSSTLDDSRQDRVGLLAAALIIQSPNVPEATSLAFAKATGALSSFWSSGYLSGQGSTAITSAAMTADGSHLVAAEGDGSVSLWDTSTLLLTDRLPGAGVRVDAMATDSEGKHVALAGPDTDLTLVDTQTGHSTAAHLPTAATLVAALPDGDWIAATTDGSLYRATSTGNVIKVFGGNAVLTVGPSRQGVRAVVRTSEDRLGLVDGESGDFIAERDWPAQPFDIAALAPDSGAVAIIGNQGQIFVAHEGLDLRPSGHSVPDLANDITMLADNRIVVSTAQFGTEIIDLSTGLSVGRICNANDSVADVVSSADGNLVACLDTIGAALWPIAGMSPTSTVPSGSDLPGHSSLTVGNVTFSGAEDGSVTVSTPGYEPASYMYGTSSVTDVEFRATGPTLAIGTANGEVFEADITTTGLIPVSDWKLPDNSPVESIVWASDGASYFARTRAGNTWERASCSGCAIPGGDLLFQRVRARLWGCYTSNQIEDIVETTRSILNVRACPGEGGN